MSAKFVNVGFGNFVSVSRIVSVVSPDAAPIKRMVQDAKETDSVIDASCGRKTKSVIVTDSRHIVLSALSVEAVGARLNGEVEKEEKENDNPHSESDG